MVFFNRFRVCFWHVRSFCSDLFFINTLFNISFFTRKKGLFLILTLTCFSFRNLFTNCSFSFFSYKYQVLLSSISNLKPTSNLTFSQVLNITRLSYIFRCQLTKVRGAWLFKNSRDHNLNLLSLAQHTYNDKNTWNNRFWQS